MAITAYTFSQVPAHGTARDFDFNPANPDQIWVLCADGYCTSKGSPPAIVGADGDQTPHYTGAARKAKCIQIVDWATSAGYVMDFDGTITAFNGAPTISSPPLVTTGIGYSSLSMNPDGSGQGWVLRSNGLIIPVGGAPNPPSLPWIFSTPNIGKRLIVDWNTMNFVVQDGFGNLHFRPGASLASADQPQQGVTSGWHQSGWWGTGWNGPGSDAWDIARDVLIDEMTGKWSGQVLDGYGAYHPWYSDPDSAPPGRTQASIVNIIGSHDYAVRSKYMAGVNRMAIMLIDGRFYDWDTGTGTGLFTVTSVTAPSGAQSSRTPTATWTPHRIGGSSNPDKVWFLLFSSDQYSVADFDPLTSPNTANSLGVSKSQTVDVTNSMPLPFQVPNGTWKVYVAVGKQQPDGSDGWSNFVASPVFTVTGSVPAPDNITPHDTYVDTDVPTLGAHLNAETLGGTVVAQWQVAKDDQFTVSMQEITGTTFVTSGNVTQKVPNAQALSSGVWFIRCREVSNGLLVSPWSATYQFAIFHPPSSRSWVPSGGQAVPYEAGGVVSLHWGFSDPNPLDSQGGYQIVVEDNGSGELIADTGYVASGATSAPITIPPGEANTELRWKIRLWDSDNIVGEFSTYQIFSVVEDANLSITAPVDTVDNPQPTVEWTYDATGRVQVSFRVVFIDKNTNLIVFDSNQVQGSATTYQITRAALKNDTDYVLAVTVYDNGGLAATQLVDVHAAWTPPSLVTGISLDGTFYESDGYITVDWDGGQTDSDFRCWRVYRTDAVGLFNDEWTLVADEVQNPPIIDFTAPAQSLVFYSVVQVADRFGVDIESIKNAASIETSSAHYWLVSNEYPDLCMRIPHVTADQFSDSYQRDSYVVLNQGRKVDQGVHLGKSGQLTCKFFDDDERGVTGRQQRMNLEALRRTQANMYLRNPYGDVWKVSTIDVQIDRVAGTGNQEVSTVTIPYEEVV